MKRLKHHKRTRKLVTALVSLALPASSFAAVNAGRVDFAIGQVTSIDKDGKQRRLVKGSRINSGDTIKTARGRAQLRFSDGGYTSLSPNTEFRIDEYSDSQEPSSAKSFFSLLKGGLRTITGAIGKLRKKAYRLTTPVATIGIRGTEYVAVLADQGLLISVGGGPDDDGITVCGSGICRDFDPGQSGFVPKAGEPPELTDEQASTLPPGAETFVYRTAEDRDDDGSLANVGRRVGDNGPFYSLAIGFTVDGDEGSVASRGSLEDDELVTGTFDSQNRLGIFTFDGPSSDSPIAGNITGQFADTGTAGGVIGWGRWTTGAVQQSPQQPVQQLHYVVGLPTAVVPTSGTADYLFAGGTQPTLVSASEGLITGTINTASHLEVNFGSPTGQVTAQIFTSIAGADFQSTIPMTLEPGANRFAFTGTGSVTTFNGDCGNCFAEGKGGFAGPGASRAGLAYRHEIDLGFGDGEEFVTGVGAFRRGAAGSAPPPPFSIVP